MEQPQTRSAARKLQFSAGRVAMTIKSIPPRAFISLFFATILCFTSSVEAATFVVRSDRDLVRRADAVVVATPLTSYSLVNGEGGVETVTQIAIEEVVKGRISATATVIEPGGAADDLATVIPGAPRFADGKKVLLFLMRTGEDHWSVLDLVIGKFTFTSDALGQDLLVRDEGEIEGYDSTPLGLQQHREPRRSAAGFLDFVRHEARGAVGAPDYIVPRAEINRNDSMPSGRRLTAKTTATALAGFTATSYTMTVSGSLGARWTVFPSPVSFYMGTTQEPGAPGGGSTAIQTAFASWNNDCASNVNYVLAGTDDGTHTQGLHGPDGRNTVLFERDLSAWGVAPFSCSGNSYSGTLGIGGITSASGSHTLNSETFVTTIEADVEMNRGLANCTVLFNSGDFNSGVAHEVGHTLGFRHADQNRASNGACSSDPSLECSTQAIMKSFVSTGINAALQPWDVHAVDALYPGNSCGPTCTAPSVTASASATSISAGQAVTLTTATSGGVTTYQWYVGASGDTSQPISSGTGATLQVSPTVTTNYWVRVGNGCGAANSNTVTITVTTPAPAPRRAKSDFNADNKSDLVLQNSQTAGITVWVMNGTGPAAGQQIAAPTGWSPVASGDVDGDGYADVIIRNPSTGGVGVYLMAPSGLAAKGVLLIGTPPTSYQVITTADFNRDGTDDLVLQDGSTGAISIWFMRNGQIISGVGVATPGPSWSLLGSGDFDGDGWPDLVLENPLNGQVVIWRMQNASIVQSATIATTSPDYRVIAAGDVNGDRKDDIILQSQSTGNVSVWIMNGFTIVNGHSIGTPGVAWVVKGRGDYNGDGIDDVVLQNTSTQAVTVWIMNSSGLIAGSGQTVPPNVYNLMVAR
jgi:hypothetical protein